MRFFLMLLSDLKILGVDSYRKLGNTEFQYNIVSDWTGRGSGSFAIGT